MSRIMDNGIRPNPIFGDGANPAHNAGEGKGDRQEAEELAAAIMLTAPTAAATTSAQGGSGQGDRQEAAAVAATLTQTATTAASTTSAQGESGQHYTVAQKRKRRGTEDDDHSSDSSDESVIELDAAVHAGVAAAHAGGYGYTQEEEDTPANLPPHPRISTKCFKKLDLPPGDDPLAVQHAMRPTWLVEGLQHLRLNLEARIIDYWTGGRAANNHAEDYLQFLGFQVHRDHSQRQPGLSCGYIAAHQTFACYHTGNFRVRDRVRVRVRDRVRDRVKVKVS